METARLRLRWPAFAAVDIDRLKLFWQFRQLLRELAIKAAINSL